MGVDQIGIVLSAACHRRLALRKHKRAPFWRRCRPASSGCLPSPLVLRRMEGKSSGGIFALCARSTSYAWCERPLDTLGRVFASFTTFQRESVKIRLEAQLLKNRAQLDLKGNPSSPAKHFHSGEIPSAALDGLFVRVRKACGRELSVLKIRNR